MHVSEFKMHLSLLNDHMRAFSSKIVVRESPTFTDTYYVPGIGLVFLCDPQTSL